MDAVKTLGMSNFAEVWRFRPVKVIEDELAIFGWDVCLNARNDAFI